MEQYYALTEFAHELACDYNISISNKEKKEKGQFFTPPSVALFMASLFIFNKTNLTVLDPGSGMGILICALCDRVLLEKKNVNLNVYLYEMEKKILPNLIKSMEQCKEKLILSGCGFTYHIIEKDFIIDNAILFLDEDVNENSKNITYDFVISNPPYFKVNKQSILSQILKDYVHGQPNIYFMFMAVAEKLIRYNGQMVFITPRSYCSGLYFERFRKKFLEIIDPVQIHIFNSRNKTFKNEQILQESIILSAIKRIDKCNEITISSSDSDNFDNISARKIKRELIVDSVYEDTIIRLPVTLEDEKILMLFDRWSNNLSSMDMEVSTGPVVSFRARQNIESVYNSEKHFPLINMQHLLSPEVQFPLSQKKNEGILKKIQEKKLLLPTENYVLLKRFSAKEQKKRIEASAFFKAKNCYEQVGLENHLNYIHRRHTPLTDSETIGLTAILNTELVDKYFRIINGNTQVNASDIKVLPLPDHDFIIKVGNNILKGLMNINDTEKLIKREFVIVANKIEEAIDALTAFGLPQRQLNDRSALTLLALLGIKKDSLWKDASRNLLRIHDILNYIAEEYDKIYAENSRESIRRQTIHQFEQAAIVERNPDDPSRPTNSGLTVYSITDEVLEVMRAYGTEKWDNLLNGFLDKHISLKERYSKKRAVTKIPIKLPDGNLLKLSSGKHNTLQKAIIEDFGPIYAKEAKLLYLGDTENKRLFVDEESLNQLGVPQFKHDKLPDVVLYDEKKDCLFLIEAVTSHGTVSPKRWQELEDMLSDCTAGKIYISAFLDMGDFKKWVNDIAWETEVWFAETPEHLLHYNGDRFLGPRNKEI